jgi:VWFA-related protein
MNRYGERVAPIACAMVTLALMLGGQPCHAQGGGQSQPFVVASHGPEQPGKLLLDVVVTDKSGKAIADLQQQDFTVLDNKQPSKVLRFQPHNPAPLGPSQVDASTEIILVFDEVNAPLPRVIYARQGIQTFLRQKNGQLEHPVSLALFTDSGMQIQTQPTLDGNALADALEHQGESVRAIDSGANDGGLARLQLSQDGLDALIARAKTRPGRKMILWIGPGWPLLSGFRDNLSQAQEQRVFNSVVRLSTEMREARMVLYSVDTLGAEGVGTSRDTFYQNFTKGLTKPDNAQLGDLGLQVLVTQTGGRVIFGNDKIENSIGHCIADLNAYYTLSIDTAPAERPNSYHSIEVKLASPALKARTRTGYYAQP